MFEISLPVEANRKAATICSAMTGFQARDVCPVYHNIIFGLVTDINCAEAITE
jgi:hypothetical protein